MIQASEQLHQGMPVATAGAEVSRARAGMILLHGRGATAENILTLAGDLDIHDISCLAPQAADNTWYPYRFIEPVERNEPWLSSALEVVDTLVSGYQEQGIPPEKIILLGFSQGACLSLEYAIRNPRRYGGIAALSGGLIGPPGTRWDFDGSLQRTPVFMGCDEEDFHIPKERVEESARILSGKGAEVTLQLYRNLGHTINHDEIEHVRSMIRLLGAG